MARHQAVAENKRIYTHKKGRLRQLQVVQGLDAPPKLHLSLTRM
jgi:hypothetical protein